MTRVILSALLLSSTCFTFPVFAASVVNPPPMVLADLEEQEEQPNAEPETVDPLQKLLQESRREQKKLLEERQRRQLELLRQQQEQERVRVEKLRESDEAT